MKLRYLFSALAAVLTFGLTSCDEDFEATYLDDLQVSKSYIAIDAEGGAEEIIVRANDVWEIKAYATEKDENGKDKVIYVDPSSDKWPSWVNVAPASGEAGEAKVTFSVSEKNDSRSHDFIIFSGNNTQRLTVQQGVLTPSEATCAEIIAGPEKNYRVKGTVKSIANTIYGNWNLADETGEILIYGTLDKDGKAKNFASLGIEVGDEVTVEGPKKVYGTTVELVDVTVIKIKKSLLKIEKVEPADAIPSEGGEFTAYCTVKGTNGVLVDLTPEQAKWISLKSVKRGTMPNPKDETLSMDVTLVTFNVKANNAAPRNTDIILGSSDEKGNSSSVSINVSQLGMLGTLEVPMTPEEAIAAAKSGATAPVYVKGIVSQLVKGGFDPGYGNGSFWISTDGKFNENLDKDFEVYQALWLGNKKWTVNNPQIEEGAEVIIYGPLTVYNGTAETQGKGAAYVYSVNGVTTDANGIGTLTNPFNAVGGVQAANGGVTNKVYVQGTVCELVKGGFDANYGNGSFWISEDGSYKGDKSVEFEAYQVNYLGGKKWNSETDPQMAVGDNVIIYGPLTVYNGTAETQGKGAAYIYSHNGKK